MGEWMSVCVCVCVCVCAIDVPTEADPCIKHSPLYGAPWLLTTAFSIIMVRAHKQKHHPPPPVHTCTHPVVWVGPTIKAEY